MTSELLLRGNTGADSAVRLWAGVTAAGAIFGNAIVLFGVLSGEFIGFDSYEAIMGASAIMGGSSILGGFLTILTAAPVLLLVVFLYEFILVQRQGRIVCSVLAGGLIGSLSVLYLLPSISFALADAAPEPGIILSLLALTTATFGSIGGGLPEILKIRYDKRMDQLTENTVPRETSVEVD